MDRPNHIEDALCKMHKGQWFTWTDPLNKTYVNLRLTEVRGIGGEVVPNPITELPTEEEVNAKLAELQTEYDASDYARVRDKAYPQLKEFAEAYTEKEIGGDSTKWDLYVTKYNKVRTDNPKG